VETTKATRRAKFEKRLENEKFGEFELIGEYTTQRTRTTFKHKVCGNVWETTPHTLINAKGTLGCPKCQYREKSKTTEEFKEELLDKFKGEFVLPEGQGYVNNRTKMKITHQVCGTTFDTSPTNLMVNKGCPTCRDWTVTRKPTEKFKRDLFHQHGDEYILSEGSEYKGANEKVKILHTICGHEWDVRASHILYRSGCPVCKESKGEKFVAKYLHDKKVEFERQYKFEDCINYKELPFDFAVFTPNGRLYGLIEYDGIQHYKSFEHFGGVEKFDKQQNNDRIKDKYCRDNSIKLLRIPYYLTSEEIKEQIDKFIVEK